MIHIGRLRVNESLAEPTRALLNSGDGVQRVISFLREQGESKAGSIRMLVAVGRLSLREAKSLVHYSDTWRDHHDADEALHEALEEVLQAMDSPPVSNVLPRAG